MHLQIVIAFALLLWWPDRRPSITLITAPAGTALFVWGKLLVVGALAWLLCRATGAKLSGNRGEANQVLSFYHRASFILRLGLLAGMAADLFLTSWPELLASPGWLRVLSGLPQLCALIPYLLGLVIVWWLLYPVEHAVRDPLSGRSRWNRRQYVMFNLRHQVLIVAVPLSVIVVTYALTRDHRAWFVGHLGSPWAPEAVLGAVAVTLFVLSPVLLRRVWATSPLPDGPLRRRLFDLCARIGLSVREILVWHSNGLVVNAAVMGLFPRIRYILLSDALLDSMSDEEIEAVFGHEAGHVRHHHIQYFLLFALVSMLIVSGVMEFLTHLAAGPGGPGWRLSENAIQALGIASVIPVWGIAFGWISRRFERQADVFGTSCATPLDRDKGCRLPCAVHDPPASAARESVCATGASTFIKALRKVALLNGIPPRERSWRHSSIASRTEFLTALSGDPIMARKFMRCIRRIKLTLILTCAAGLGIAAYYIWQHPGYRRAVFTSVIEPLTGLFQ